MMWKGANFGVVDLGTNVSPEKFVAAAREHKASVVGLSALLTTTMPAMKQTVTALRNSDMKHVKVVIGGAHHAKLCHGNWRRRLCRRCRQRRGYRAQAGGSVIDSTRCVARQLINLIVRQRLGNHCENSHAREADWC